MIRRDSRRHRANCGRSGRQCDRCAADVYDTSAGQPRAGYGVPRAAGADGDRAPLPRLIPHWKMLALAKSFDLA
jgi:hypothetical protein